MYIGPIKCPQCDSPISSDANVCPYCHSLAPMTAPWRSYKLSIAMGVVALTAALVAWTADSCFGTEWMAALKALVWHRQT